ncbi:efflux RND transporter permease subunit [Marinimicrobium sp. LS-A18]|uniref:efflux RND transporter permease subunit n=1 Tax=Marinimicrobium sp. LS-A18 TaxID=1381596 RepID=UPI000463AE78|nr:efflux RND transporter permease subunit [Marinimicrobium sp. LS-A18]
MSEEPRLGLSGRIARQFLTTEITPLLALVGLLLGLFAVLVTPREEEPQIDVTFANVFIPYPGAAAREVEQLVATPAEQILSEIAGVEHIYSASRPGMAVLTVQFEVGETRQETIVRLYNAFYSNQDWVPANAGIGQPLIKPMGIDDVPIVAGTLWSDDPAVGAHELARVAHTIETELQRVPGTRDIDTIGAPTRAVNVRLDPQKLAGYGLDIQSLSQALMASNVSREAGNVVADNRVIQVQAGSFLSSATEVAELVVGMNRGGPVFLKDVADITLGPDQPEQYVSFGMGPAHDLSLPRQPAVTVAVAKQPGSNAVEVARQVIERFEHLQGTFVPEGINATVTRDYGKTANDKAQTLIKKLLFATASVVLLVLVTLGWRESLVVGAAVVVTLAITLFASWAYGFTLNRVSLFALIFSIGILVDDAIVVVENIHRRATGSLNTMTDRIPYAVEEVGGPTILATFTVIAALLPMAFVSGLMGPYMAPIPINASMGMLISLIVAFMFTPWLYRRLFARVEHHEAVDENDRSGFAHRLSERLMTPFLRAREGRGARVGLLVVLLVLIGGSMALVGFQAVVMKMLPFDNKSEFQVVVEMPEGTPVEQTNRVLNALGDHLETVPEVLDYQTYSGTASPINFNGLVRQYYLRREPHQGDIQVNLVDKSKRDRKSHDIARAVRAPLQDIGRELDATVKIVEVPPGPPVMAPIVAEIYGLDYRGQMEVAKEVRSVFENTQDLVDIDDDIEAPQRKLVAEVDRQRAARLGVSQQAIADTLTAALSGSDVTYLHGTASKAPIPIRLELNEADKANQALLGSLSVISQSGTRVPLSEVVQFRETTRDQTIYHKDLLPVTFVYADMAGPLDSPLYGMLDVVSTLNETPIKGDPLAQFWTDQPDNPYAWSLKWDGEWQITYETFRDMGIAYSVGLILIYLLVVAQFRSYGLPLIIMAPIPLTLIGILPGHALLDKQFTATSMIGMIALAGIIVRNSILLVDFVQHQQKAGKPLAEAVIDAAAVRARPIILTALAATMGAFFILDDPIFSGLAVSLIFGIAVSTLLTLLVIPVVYYAYHYQHEPTP